MQRLFNMLTPPARWRISSFYFFIGFVNFVLSVSFRFLFISCLFQRNSKSKQDSFFREMNTQFKAIQVLTFSPSFIKHMTLKIFPPSAEK